MKCDTCNGTGKSNDAETNGLCWDCRGQGSIDFPILSRSNYGRLTREDLDRYDVIAATVSASSINEIRNVMLALITEVRELTGARREGEFAYIDTLIKAKPRDDIETGLWEAIVSPASPAFHGFGVHRAIGFAMRALGEELLARNPSERVG